MEANTYLTLRSCVIKGAGNDTAVIAINGKVTLELYSTKIINGSVSMFEGADFRLEMNDSYIEYPSEEFCSLAFRRSGHSDYLTIRRSQGVLILLKRQMWSLILIIQK